MTTRQLIPTCTHWGNYLIDSDGKRIRAVETYPADLEPTDIRHSLLDMLDERARIARPSVRQRYLRDPENCSPERRGEEPYCEVPWDEALDLAAQAIERVQTRHGPNAIYGGSYGWSSAGRFHHAQSQIHRFLGMAGGYVSSMNSYSTAAAEVIIGHVLAMPLLKLVREAPPIDEVAKHARTVVFFGGAALKNTQVNAGGIGCHSPVQQLMALKDAGVQVVNVSPIEDDLMPSVGAQWLACRPGSDVAIMLGMAHTLVTEGLHDEAFLDRYTVGFEQFRPYLLGESDDQPKSAEWASALSDIPADRIRSLARQLAAERSLIAISWSLQRQEYGEQTWWMITVLGCLLGHIGLPGGGIGYGYGCIHNMGFGGRRIPNFRLGALTLEIGERIKPTHDFIPVARHADMLNHPGETYRYNGQALTYPDIRLIYWAGGNPFHHHQDLNALRQAWHKPEAIIVNEPFWTTTARHADIVFPATTTLERDDLGGSSYDTYISPMRAAAAPFAESRDDFEIFAGLAERLGFGERFTEGRSVSEWVEHLYETTRDNAEAVGVDLPAFDSFWESQQIDLIDQLPDADFDLEQFRRDPENHALHTSSGRIEIFSETIHDFGEADCAGHPMWFEHKEWLGNPNSRFPLHLISNQPRTRLHSQLDHARTSKKRKIQQRERARMNPQDASSRGLADGDVIRIYNDRGATLAGLEISAHIRPGVIELPTGAWFDPLRTDEALLEVHGNPNAVTPDRGTSSLAQGCSAHSCLVEVDKYTGNLPAITVHDQPAMAPRLDA